MYPYSNQFNRFSNQNRPGNSNRRPAHTTNSDTSSLNSRPAYSQKRSPSRPFMSFFNSSGQTDIRAVKYSESEINAAHNENDNQNNNMNNTPDNNMNTPPNEMIPDKDDCMEINAYIVKMLIEAIKDEIRDAHFYDSIAEMLSDEDDRKIFHKIHHDEDKHKKIFTEIYEILTGETPSPEELMTDEKEISENMIQNFSDAIFDELSAVEFYRKLYFAFLNQEIRDSLFEVITDEQSHAQILNYMYSKYTANTACPTA